MVLSRVAFPVAFVQPFSRTLHSTHTHFPLVMDAQSRCGTICSAAPALPVATSSQSMPLTHRSFRQFTANFHEATDGHQPGLKVESAGRGTLRSLRRAGFRNVTVAADIVDTRLSSPSTLRLSSLPLQSSSSSSSLSEGPPADANVDKRALRAAAARMRSRFMLPASNPVPPPVAGDSEGLTAALVDGRLVETVLRPADAAVPVAGRPAWSLAPCTGVTASTTLMMS